MDYNTKHGKLSTLKVTYYSYGSGNCGPAIGPFKTREEAEKSRSELDGEVFESQAEGFDALVILDKFERMDNGEIV